MEKVVFDTNIYIDWINNQKHADIIFKKGIGKFLSSIVLMELYAGTFQKKDQKLIDKIFSSYLKANRVFSPSLND